MAAEAVREEREERELVAVEKEEEDEEKVYSIKAIIENCRTDVRKLTVIDSLLLPSLWEISMLI